MDQLKVEIERIVQPLRAARALKNKFRQELWAHLGDLYEEECASTSDSEVAAAKALERLGDPDVLRAQLRDSMKLSEKIEGAGGHWMGPRTGEALTKQVLRLGLSYYVLGMGMVGIMIAILWLSPKNFDLEDTLFTLVLSGAVVGPLTATFGSCVALIEAFLARNASELAKARFFASSVLAWSMFSCVFMLITGVIGYAIGHALLAQILGPEHLHTLTFDMASSVMIKGWCGMIVAGCLIIMFCETYFPSRLPDWPYAE